MSENTKDTTEKGIENVEVALNRAEQFIEKNQKILTIIAAAILLVVAVFFLSKRFYFAPKEHEAQAQMFYAEKYFEKDSFKLALNGDGNNLGFVQVIDDYGFTKTANLASYYAGICYLRMGDFQNAINYLEKYSGNDTYVYSVAKGAIGDAYCELGNKEKAVKYYTKAAEHKENTFISPIYLMKAGQLLESLNKYNEALENYETIKLQYPFSAEARQIEKYITRVKLLK